MKANSAVNSGRVNGTPGEEFNSQMSGKLAKMKASLKTNKPGPAQVGAILEAQKLQKDFKMSKYW